MADHNVTLNYVPTGKPAPDDIAFVPDPPVIMVKAGQTISFELGPGAPPGTIRLTFATPHLFSTKRANFQTDGIFLQGDGDVKVVATPDKRTSYDCELVGPNGKVAARSHKNGGGDIDPDKGN